MNLRNVTYLKSQHRFYDPLGLLSPITAKLKIIFQLLCKDKFEWDAKIPSDIESVWNDLLSELYLFNSVRVKRFIFDSVKEKIESVEVHVFCDSSIQAYCGVVYLRVVTSVGVCVNLLASKRVWEIL